MYPRIGIRPVIDGRRFGVRESLEKQTMDMALAAKQLIEGNCRYPDSNPVECVIAPCTIGSGKEAAVTEEFFSDKNVIATLSVTPCWGSVNETIDLNPITIKAVWGFNGTERPSAVYLSAAMSAHAHRGLPAFSIYGHDVKDADDTEIPEDVAVKILRFARCAVAVGWIRAKAYVSIGSSANGITGTYCDAAFLHDYLGLRPEWVDMTEILRRMHLEIYDHDEYRRALDWTVRNCPVGMNINTEKINPGNPKLMSLDDQWEFCVKMTLIVRDIMLGNEKLSDIGREEEAEGRNAVMGGFCGGRTWTDWLPNGDFCESILSTSFDWNGRKQPIAFATDNDSLNGTSMLFGSLISGTASVFANLRTYWSPDAYEKAVGSKPEGRAADGFIHLINSGAAALDGTGMAKDNKGIGMMKKWWEVTERDMADILGETDWCPANLGYFRGGGFSSHFRTEAEMPVTMIKVNIIDGLGPAIQIAEGYTVVFSENIHCVLDDRTDKTWPTTWFVPRLMPEKTAFRDVYSVMSCWGSDHAAFTYGHIGSDIITLASMLRIPVSMHNISDEDIYRPHCWSAFGTSDLEDADYRACSCYGPRYK